MTEVPSAQKATPAGLFRGAAGLVALAVGAVLLAATLVLWARFGTAVFFDMVASGIAACF